ncbi:MAG: cytochrome c [Haliangiales bacterium]
MNKTLVASLVLCIAMGACKRKPPPEPKPDDPEVDQPTGPVISPNLPKDWAKEQARRREAKAAYIAEHQAAYDWFANFPFSEKDGYPYIILRLLPVIAPELWGSEDNFLDVAGLFMDERQPDYPLARGVGFSGLARAEPGGNIDYVSFTCGACHIGRVALADGTIQYLDGAVNTEFNVAQFRTRVYQTLQKMYGDHTSRVRKDLAAGEAIIEALDTMHLQDPNFFYKDYQYNDRHFDAEYEAAQVKLFKKKALTVIPLYLLRAEMEFEAYKALIAKNYQGGFEAQMLAGTGGMIDATGVNLGNVYVLERLTGAKDPTQALPPTPGITDIMAVWEQGKRRAHWNDDQTALIGGAGQWNGNIPIPIYRNLIAALTFGLIGTDVRVAAFGEELLDGLSADPYPFEVDLALATTGEALFQTHCVDCHRPHNGTTYTELGTDMNRAKVVDESIAASARRLLKFECGLDTEIDLGQGKVKPCATFDGVSLAGKEQLIMSPVNEHWGYNALPLGGVWAQAPYLHNGSVPTLYHLLVADERPATFVKGRLEYDETHVGYSWDPSATSATGNPYVFNTAAADVTSNRGHDRDVTRDGKTYKLNWTDDKDGARALVEYMKTL